MRKWIIYIFLSTPCLLVAQVESIDPDISRIIESVFPFIEEDQPYDDLFEHYRQFYYRPLNLNSANYEQFQSLYLFSQAEIDLIFKYRQSDGIFLSKYELYFIDGLDSATIKAILPFITAEPVANRPDSLSIFKNLITTSRRSVLFRYSRLLETKIGYINRQNPAEILNGRYFTGSPDQLYGRVEIDEVNDFRMGFTFEKDAGEPIFWHIPTRYYGFDHYSGFLHLENRGIFKGITFGNFQMQTGQGLVMGGGIFSGKGAEVISTVKRADMGVRPYQGVTEAGYFRGLAFSVGGKRWLGTGFLSYNNLDGTLTTGTHAKDEILITSFKTDGYHRTPDELFKRGVIREEVAGLNIKYQSFGKNLTLGLNFLVNQNNYKVRKERSYYNLLPIGEKTAFNAGGYYDYYKGKFNIFGELAMSGNGAIGIVNGVMANLSSKIETSFLFRCYGPNYLSRYGRAYGEFSNQNNELGIYWSLKLMPLPKLGLSMYYDLFKPIWFRYNMASFDLGHEYLVKLTYKISWNSTINLLLKEQSKDKNMTDIASTGYLTATGIKKNLQINYKSDFNNHIQIQTRISGSNFLISQYQTYGYALAQDFGYQLKKGSMNLRAAYFNTDDYENRQFMYEKDVLMYYSVPGYAGEGLRFFILLKYEPVRNFDLWLKAGTFWFFNLEETGSGLNLIPGNKKSEIKCQVRIKF